MPIIKKLANYLKSEKIKYEELKHKTVYTAHDKAKTLRVPEKIIAKTLVLKADKNFVLVLIPANKNLDKAKFKKTVNDWKKKKGQKLAKKIDFVTEVWIKNNLKGIKIGAIPPFGKLWQLPAFLDKTLLKEKEIILNGGNYNFSVKVKTKDLGKLDFILGVFSKPR